VKTGKKESMVRPFSNNNRAPARPEAAAEQRPAEVAAEQKPAEPVATEQKSDEVADKQKPADAAGEPTGAEAPETPPLTSDPAIAKTQPPATNEPAATPQLSGFVVTARLKLNGRQYEIGEAVEISAEEAANIPWAVKAQ
jgi:hypothetical protein